MSKDYTVARELFEMFLDQDDIPDPTPYIERCPPDQLHVLLRAFATLNRVMDFYTTPSEVRPGQSERLLDRIDGLRRQEVLMERSRTSGKKLSEVLLEDAKARVAANRQLLENDPVRCLSDALNIGTSGRKVGVLNRTETARRSGVPDELWFRSQEEKVKQVVDELLHDIGSANGDQRVDLDTVASHLGVLVEKVSLTPSIATQGFFVTDGDVGGIVVNTNPSRGNLSRQRFTFAHEIGHSVLHRTNGTATYGDGVAELRNYLDQVEQEANLFAANLLIPSQMVERIYTPIEIPTFRHASQLADISGASGQAVLTRLVRMSDHPVAFVVLYKGKVSWWLQSPHFEGKARIGENAPTGSIARQQVLAPDERISPTSQNVRNPIIWLDDVESYSSLEEESYKVSQDYVYTILTLK